MSEQNFGHLQLYESNGRGPYLIMHPVTVKLRYVVMLLLAIAGSLAACSSVSSPNNAVVQSKLTLQTQELEKLKSAEYRDDMSAMDLEESNRKLGDYYAAKGVQVHGLIDQMEQGQPVDDIKISRALDDSDSAKYDIPPPPPLDDETELSH